MRMNRWHTTNENCRGNYPTSTLKLLDTMKYQVIAADQLTEQHVDAWSRIQQADPALASAYFTPEFTLAVGAVRDRAEVAVMEEDGLPVGFLPYHRGKANVAEQIADTLTDFQGAIVREGVRWDLKALFRACGISAMYWDHVAPGQKAFLPHRWSEAPSPYMDVEGGFEAYRKNRNRPGSDKIKQALRKMRKLEREQGPLRLEACSSDPKVFETLIEWKRAQYVRTNTRDVFSCCWTVELLRRIGQLRGEALCGMLSALYVGDRLAAVHMGMMSRGVMHWWFPAYDVGLSRYSPGMIQLIRMVQEAPELGINRIDLGKGSEQFKTQFMTGSTPVAEGGLDLRPIVRPLQKMWLQTQKLVRSSRLHAPARIVARNMQQWFGAGKTKSGGATS